MDTANRCRLLNSCDLQFATNAAMLVRRRCVILVIWFGSKTVKKFNKKRFKNKH